MLVPVLISSPTVSALPLLPDGSFEGCFGCNCAWECTANNNFDWIINPSNPSYGWDIDAFDGDWVAWLGGFYGGAPNQNKFCVNTVNVLGECIVWRWMGWVPEGHTGNRVRVTMNGTVVFEKELRYPEDHTYPNWGILQTENLLEWDSIPDVEFCIEFIPTDGANMLVDYIEWVQHCTTAVETTSFSTIKAYYR
ncbi:hypothetical protein FJ251_10200 [bacterium]|nr:hypothetical protein [bacterium]